MPSSPLPIRKTASDENNTEPSKSAESLSGEVSEQPMNPRLVAMQAKKANLEAKLAALQAERSTLAAQTKLPSGLSMPDEWSDDEKLKQALISSNAVIKEHIGLLHRYNEIKDIGQGLMGMIAESRGVRVGVIQEEYGMGEKD